MGFGMLDLRAVEAERVVRWYSFSGALLLPLSAAMPLVI
jgi:hypothetical protein